MSTSEDKKRWKKESEQLKSDLKKRKKIIQKREVEVKFPKKKPIVPSPQTNSSKNIDQYFKQQIKID